VCCSVYITFMEGWNALVQLECCNVCGCAKTKSFVNTPAHQHPPTHKQTHTYTHTHTFHLPSLFSCSLFLTISRSFSLFLSLSCTRVSSRSLSHAHGKTHTRTHTQCQEKETHSTKLKKVLFKTLLVFVCSYAYVYVCI